MASGYWKQRNRIERKAVQATLRKDKLKEQYLRDYDKKMLAAYTNVESKVMPKLTNLYEDITSTVAKGEPVNASLLFQYKEYYTQLQDIRWETNKLGSRMYNVLEADMRGLYQNNFNLTSGFFKADVTLPSEYVERALTSTWTKDNILWSDRVWGNNAQLYANLQSNLITCAATEGDVDEFVRNAVHSFGISASDAKRLATTELSHIYNQAAVDCYKDMGIEYVEWVTVDGEDACEVCSDMNGEQIDIRRSDLMPPEASHPNCRCTIMPITE